MNKTRKIAVISTGNGGQALAAYFAYHDAAVSLYAREQERIDMFRNRRFQLSGILDVEVEIDILSCDMETVIKDAELIMVTTPAQYHLAVAKEMAPFLQDNQIVVLNPGRSFGTCVFDKEIRNYNPNHKVVIAEADTFIFTCRCNELAKPIIYKIKDSLKIAAHNPKDTEKVVCILSDYFEGVTMANNILETGVGNMGMIFHPLPVLMNLTRIEKQEKFLYYHNAISPMVAGILDRLDQERMLIAESFGIKTKDAKSWLKEKYGSEGATLYDCIQNTEAYSDVYAPTDVYTRYVFEDVPTGIVPMLALGKIHNLSLPVMEGIVCWANAVYDTDFYEKGRNENSIDFDILLKSSN